MHYDKKINKFVALTLRKPLLKYIYKDLSNVQDWHFRCRDATTYNNCQMEIKNSNSRVYQNRVKERKITNGNVNDHWW